MMNERKWRVIGDVWDILHHSLRYSLHLVILLEKTNCKWTQKYFDWTALCYEETFLHGWEQSQWSRSLHMMAGNENHVNHLLWPPQLTNLNQTKYLREILDRF